MKHLLQCVTILVFGIAAGLHSQEPPPDGPDARMLIEAEDAGAENLEFGRTLDHFDERGYPVDSRGRLVFEEDDEGPLVYMEGEDFPFLLYAQYVNRQRDAVFLARTGPITDVLPDGSTYTVPFGYGSLKTSAISISVVEGLIVPHVSDARKDYEDFPLQDLYLGLGFGISGLKLGLRYVHTERWVARLESGVNLAGGFPGSGLIGAHWVPLHVGGGYRFPGLFDELFGPTLWTAGLDLLVGFGDRDLTPTTPVVSLMPGLTFEIERGLIDGEALDRDYRSDPRPANHGLTTVALRLGLYFNLFVPGSGVVYPTLDLSFSTNIVGPTIPDHAFNSTDIIFVHEQYREDIQRQLERREARERRGS